MQASWKQSIVHLAHHQCVLVVDAARELPSFEHFEEPRVGLVVRPQVVIHRTDLKIQISTNNR